MSAKVRFLGRYKDIEGIRKDKHFLGDVDDHKVSKITENMPRWSNDKYEAYWATNELIAQNRLVVPSLRATQGMSEEMSSIIAYHTLDSPSYSREQGRRTAIWEDEHTRWVSGAGE
ncbi:hypothetical protein K461DRAFT_267511 [Myriangium duriaei CBS 260.36]|uniref:Uncharacterized protein n=1 Tax=Myriangium duriaei CBS 260.36 TaxID=1168546 RepID=A0A9P4J087_9PEZI|nr:hypothetical protein K461DRAFT_267511 [Myriangium duriaei CBS 260.36]